MTKMLMNDATGLSLRGVQIDQEEDGTFDVPEHLVPLAAAYGATVVPVAVLPSKPVPQWTNDDLKAKALELGLTIEGLDRPALSQAVTGALKGKE